MILQKPRVVLGLCRRSIAERLGKSAGRGDGEFELRSSVATRKGPEGSVSGDKPQDGVHCKSGLRVWDNI